MDQTPKYSTTYKHCSKLTITITTGRIAAVGEGGRGEARRRNETVFPPFLYRLVCIFMLLTAAHQLVLKINLIFMDPCIVENSV